MVKQPNAKRRVLLLAMMGVFPLFATRDAIGMAGITETGAIERMGYGKGASEGGSPQLCG